MVWQHFNLVPCFRSWERRSDSRGHRRHERVLDERIEGGFGSHALLLDEGLVHPLRGRGKSPKRRGEVQVESSELKSRKIYLSTLHWQFTLRRPQSQSLPVVRHP